MRDSLSAAITLDNLDGSKWAIARVVTARASLGRIPLLISPLRAIDRETHVAQDSIVYSEQFILSRLSLMSSMPPQFALLFFF